MEQKLNQADIWLINEIENALINKYKITSIKAKEYINNSTFSTMLIEHPSFTHHEGVEQWVKIISFHNGLN